MELFKTAQIISLFEKYIHDKLTEEDKDIVAENKKYKQFHCFVDKEDKLYPFFLKMMDVVKVLVEQEILNPYTTYFYFKGGDIHIHDLGTYNLLGKIIPETVVESEDQDIGEFEISLIDDTGYENDNSWAEGEDGDYETEFAWVRFENFQEFLKVMLSNGDDVEMMKEHFYHYNPEAE